MFEGEGTIRGQTSTRLVPQVSIDSTDYDVLERFHSWARCGVVYGPYWNKGSTKPYWRWNVGNIADIRQFLERILPLLCGRRAERARTALAASEHIVARGPWARGSTRCKRGHLLSGDNLYIRPRGVRVCRACQAAQARARRNGTP